LVGGAARDDSELGYPHFDDDSTLPGQGPMLGLASALRVVGAPVLLVACDMPELAPGILRLLILLAGNAVAAAPVVDGRLEPLCGLYRPAILPVALASLCRGSGRMADLFQVPGTRRIDGAALGELAAVRASLRNLNRPQDL
jgi:molybdopterin-guanine dinucleotide biosynthesis protein A